MQGPMDEVLRMSLQPPWDQHPDKSLEPPCCPVFCWSLVLPLTLYHLGAKTPVLKVIKAAGSAWGYEGQGLATQG